jgi:hypothetical protein
MTRLRAAAERLARGCALVVPRRTAAVAAWVRAAEGTADRLIRAGMLLGAALLAWRAARMWPFLLWVAVPALLVAAWRTAPAPVDEAEETRGEEPPAAPPVEAIRTLLWQLIGDAPGVHLNTVLAHLQKHGHHPSWKVADLRRHLERHGIPVEPKLKLSGTPTRGVRREALGTPPPVADRAPSPTASTTV